MGITHIPGLWDVCLAYIGPNSILGYQNCTDNDLDGLQFVWDRRLLSLDEIRKFGNLAFRRACLGNHLKLARWLWERGLTLEDARAGGSEAFRCSCARGLLESAKFVWEIGLTHEDLHAQNDYAIIAAEQNGHKEVSSWLQELIARERHDNC